MNCDGHLFEDRPTKVILILYDEDETSINSPSELVRNKKWWIKMGKEIDLKIDKYEEKLTDRTFKTGNVGYGFYGKLTIDGKRYQVTLNMVELK